MLYSKALPKVNFKFFPLQKRKFSQEPSLGQTKLLLTRPERPLIAGFLSEASDSKKENLRVHVAKRMLDYLRFSSLIFLCCSDCLYNISSSRPSCFLKLMCGFLLKIVWTGLSSKVLIIVISGFFLMFCLLYESKAFVLIGRDFVTSNV